MNPRADSNTPIAVFTITSTIFALMSVGCGASYQAVYEGEVRFEHCYRLDEEFGISLAQRRECWRQWSQFYTYGQTRDRLEYALRRQRELSAEIQNPDAVSTESQPSPIQINEPVAAPAPTTPFAPPPRVHDRPKAAAAGTDIHLLDALTAEQQPSAQPCLVQCISRSQPCIRSCDPKSSDECRKGCDAAFQACTQRCF
ncbi:MAG: hypothetical protein FWD57_10810 [Polyangiaceae bacterium]|nr:hypothetical protein [Polyangiaceae bacterium]